MVRLQALVITLMGQSIPENVEKTNADREGILWNC
jgi:hypothetical protein